MENGSNHLFLSQNNIQKGSGLRVTSKYGSILSLINVRSPSKLRWTPVNVHSTGPHINVSCIVISCYTFAFVPVISVNFV